MLIVNYNTVEQTSQIYKMKVMLVFKHDLHLLCVYLFLSDVVFGYFLVYIGPADA
jgi:hypothetical protein